MDYSRINDLIEESDFVGFADYGDGIADEWICKAETCLGLKLQYGLQLINEYEEKRGL